MKLVFAYDDYDHVVEVSGEKAAAVVAIKGYGKGAILADVLGAENVLYAFANVDHMADMISSGSLLYEPQFRANAIDLVNVA